MRRWTVIGVGAGLLGLLAYVFFLREIDRPLEIPATSAGIARELAPRVRAAVRDVVHLPAATTPVAEQDDPGHGELHGVVRDAETLAPIASADLSFLANGVVHETSTAADGTFTFAAPAEGHYDLVDIAAPGYTSFNDDWGQPSLSFVATAGARVDGIVLTLEAVPKDSPASAPVADASAVAGTVSGIVVDESGAPIEDAHVTTWARGTAATYDAHSDASGAFSVALPRGRGPTIAASHRGYVATFLRKVKPGRTDLKLVLSQGGTLTGRVVSADDGQAVRAFMIRVESEAQRFANTGQTFFDPDGKFSLTGVAPGTNVVRAYALGWAPSAPVTIDVQGTTEVKLALARGGRVVGRVIDDADRTPVAGALVSTESRWVGEGSPSPVVAEVRTDAAGKFAIAGLGAGLRTITVDAPGYHPRFASGFDVRRDGDVGPVEIGITKVAPGETPHLDLVGIGANVELVGDKLVLRRLFDGGPGREAGLLPGDSIVAIDGAPVAGLSMEDGIERLRGSEGSSVVLTVERDGNVRQLTVMRRRVRG